MHEFKKKVMWQNKKVVGGGHTKVASEPHRIAVNIGGTPIIGEQ